MPVQEATALVTVSPPAVLSLRTRDRARAARRISRDCGVAVAVIGLIVLAGWAFGVRSLESIDPRLVSMKPNAALGFVLGASALILLRPGPRARRRRAVCFGLTAIVAAIGLATLFEYLTGVNLGLDQMLFRDSATAVDTVAPGRMAAPSAIGFVLAAAALGFLWRGWARAAQLAAGGVLVLALTALLGYVYGDTLSRPAGSTAVGVHTAAAFLLLGVGLMLARPRAGLVGVLLADDPGGLMARWLVTVVFLALPVFGALRMAGQESGLFGPRVGVGIMVLSSLVTLTIVIALAASRLSALSEQRTLALRELERSEARLRRLLDHLMRVQEAEHRRLAADIHDDALPALAAVGLQLELARGQCTDAELRARLERAEEELRAGGRRLRHLAFDLRPEALVRAGLGPALRQRLDRLAELTGIGYEFHDRVGREPSALAADTLYRVAVEALNNVARHAHALRVRVDVERRDGRFVLTVADDGVGMPRAQARPGHMGLAMMSERAEMAGGAVRLDSRPGAGTSLVAWVPVDLAGGVDALI